MNELTDKYIEDAFSKIRAEFEKRNNATGLEILDGYEEQWGAYGSLTDRQIGWLEKQLDGSWLSTEKQTTISGGNHSPKTKLEIVTTRNEPATDDHGDLLDAMIQQRLKGEGKVIIDVELLDALVAMVEKLRGVVR